MTNFFIKTTMMIVLITILGRLLSFFRNVFLISEFGVSVETDAYLLAFIIPLSLFLIVPGAVNSVLIPTFKGLMQGEELARRNELFHKSMAVMILCFFFISVAGMVWANEMVMLLAPGFSPEKQLLTAELLRIMMPSALFIGIIAVMTSVLNAHFEFFAPTLGTVVNGLIVIISIYTLAPMLGIHGVAWGTTIGYILFAIYLIRPILKRKYSIKLNLKLRQDTHIRSMGERFVPIMIGMVISQIYLVGERIMASGLGDQKLTTLVLANSIIQLPVAIFAGALAIPFFPLLAEYVKKNQMERMKEILGKGLLIQYHLLLPATLGFILLSEEFVRFFYDYGSGLTQEEAQWTAWAMIFYSFSMIGLSGRDLLTRASYAIENTKTPVKIGAVCAVAYVIFSLILIGPLDHGGLALAFSLANLLNLVLQSYFLKKQIGTLYTRAFYISISKGMLAVTFMSLGIWLLREFTSEWGKLQIPILIIVAAVVYGGMLHILKEDLLKELVHKLKKRVKPGGEADGA